MSVEGGEVGPYVYRIVYSGNEIPLLLNDTGLELEELTRVISTMGVTDVLGIIRSGGVTIFVNESGILGMHITVGNQSFSIDPNLLSPTMASGILKRCHMNDPILQRVQ